jgi:hypothetical protein
MRIRDAKIFALGTVLVAIATVGAPCHSEVLASGSTAVQSRESYEAAIRNHSTSPSYVLVSVSTSENGPATPICTTANFLLGAIHTEHELGYTKADSKRAVAIAIENLTHVFRFRKQAAVNNIIPVRYSENALTTARSQLSGFSSDELKAQFSLLRGSHFLVNADTREAIACVLIERGLSPKSDDRSGRVYIDQ